MIDRPTKLIRNSTADFLIFTGQVGELCSVNDETPTSERPGAKL